MSKIVIALLIAVVASVAHSHVRWPTVAGNKLRAEKKLCITGMRMAKNLVHQKFQSVKFLLDQKRRYLIEVEERTVQDLQTCFKDLRNINHTIVDLNFAEANGVIKRCETLATRTFRMAHFVEPLENLLLNFRITEEDLDRKEKEYPEISIDPF